MPLPPLREELAINPGPRLLDGQPSWTLHDPVRNQFFRIDWLTFEILRRWSLLDPESIAHSIREETALEPDAQDIVAVIQFLSENQLLQPQGNDVAKQFAARYRSLRGNWKNWLLHHYLFFRIPLLKPDAWLEKTLRYTDVFYSRRFLQLTFLALALGVVSVFRDWDRFSSTLIDTLTWQGLAGYGVTLVGIKFLHELGHAYTAKRFGCRVPSMGVAFLVLWPMAYTDTNEVWRLTDNRKRLAVASAGIATEMIVAAWATLAWAFLPAGLPKSMAFMLATTSWIATLAINSSPFMRFDGYFLLSDWLDLPNLHNRAFALARWHLRERLFALGSPPPEYFSKRRERFLILFAWGTWIYRLALFLGIAVLVYHFFIKVVGIFLFLVEIVWFVAKPIYGEVSVWKRLWPVIRERKQYRASSALFIAFLIFAVIPWPARLTASGLLQPAQYYVIYPPDGAQITRMLVSEGQPVEAGSLLIEMASPALLMRWEKAQARLRQVTAQAEAARLDPNSRQHLQVMEQAQRAAEAELMSTEAEVERYSPRARFSGVVRDIAPDLNAGVWVKAKEPLGTLVQPGHWQVETYLDEDHVGRISVGDHGRFFMDGLTGPHLDLTVKAIEADATHILPSGILTTASGGSIGARELHGAIVPDRAVYRVLLTVDEHGANLPEHIWRGRVVINGSWEAPALAYIRSALAVAWREAGF